MSISITGPDLVERRTTVSIDDGVSLDVLEYRSIGARVTVVLLHGHCLCDDSWSDVREDLMQRYSDARIL